MRRSHVKTSPGAAGGAATRGRGPLRKIGGVSILIGLAANAFASNVAFSLLAEPDGARIRPFGEIGTILFATLLGVCGIALASVPVREKSTRWIGGVGLILGLTPLPLGIVMMRIVIQLRHLTILP